MVLSARLAVLSLVVLSQFALSSSFTVTTPRLLLAPSILSSNPQRHSSIPPALSLAMSEEKPSRVGAKTDYMKKIPSHLQGIAVRRKQQVVQEYTSGKLSEEEAETARIQKELEEDSDETFDMAMEILELDQVDVSKFVGDIDDAALLRDLKNKMDPRDFAHIFGKGVGDLL